MYSELKYFWKFSLLQYRSLDYNAVLRPLQILYEVTHTSLFQFQVIIILEKFKQGICKRQY